MQDTESILETKAKVVAPLEMEWVLAPTRSEIVGKRADKIIDAYLGENKDVGEVSGMVKAAEFAKSGKKLEELAVEDFQDDIALELRLTDEKERLNQKDIQFLKELEDFLGKLTEDQFEMITDSVYMASEKLALAMGVDEGHVASNTAHSKKVVKNVALLGGSRLVQLMAAGHDGIKSGLGNWQDLAGHEAKSAIFNASVGMALEGELGDLGFGDERIVPGALGRFLELSFHHRDNEFPEQMAAKLGKRSVEVEINKQKIQVEVSLVWGSKAVRLDEDKYKKTAEGVDSDSTRWVNERAELMQTADIATGLSPNDLEKYHLAYRRKPDLAEIIASDPIYYNKIFASFLDNILGAMDRLAMKKYMETDEFKHSLVIRRLMRGGKNWKTDETLSEMTKTGHGAVVGMKYGDLVGFRETQKDFFGDPGNDTEENWTTAGANLKENFHTLVEAVKDLPKEVLDQVAATEGALLEQELGTDWARAQ